MQIIYLPVVSSPLSDYQIKGCEYTEYTDYHVRLDAANSKSDWLKQQLTFI